jgi:uncharacterized protein YcfJ
MKNTLVKIFAGSALAAAALASAPASAMDILARVISSTPVVQQVAVPRQVCSNETVMMQAPKSGAGALMGAIAGGAAGNAIGNGGGRAAATVIGLVGGAMVGDRVEGPNNQLQNVQQCSTQTYYENRPSYFNVVYEYQGTQYNAQMANDPGSYVRLQVTPVGAVAPAPQQADQNQPQTYYQPALAQQPVYVQPAVVVTPGYPAYYARPSYGPSYYGPSYYAPSYAPSYAPYYAPIGLSLNFGYSRGFGGHRGRWR